MIHWLIQNLTDGYHEIAELPNSTFAITHTYNLPPRLDPRRRTHGPGRYGPRPAGSPARMGAEVLQSVDTVDGRGLLALFFSPIARGARVGEPGLIGPRPPPPRSVPPGGRPLHPPQL